MLRFAKLRLVFEKEGSENQIVKLNHRKKVVVPKESVVSINYNTIKKYIYSNFKYSYNKVIKRFMKFKTKQYVKMKCIKRRLNIMKNGKRNFKILITICMSLAFVLLFATQSFADPYSQKYFNCPNCNTLNASYSYDEDVAHVYTTVFSGKTCKGCNKVVPEGEQHTSMYTKDNYFFFCNSTYCKNNVDVSDRLYSHEFPNPISEHEIAYEK